MMVYDITKGGFVRKADPRVFEVSGELELPVSTPIGPLHYVEREYKIGTIKAEVRDAGTADYEIIIKSYGSLGGTATTHVTQTVTFSSDRKIISFTPTTALVSANRSLEVSVRQLTGTPSSDLTVTVL